MRTIITMLKYDFKRFLRDWLMVAFSVAILIMYVAVATFVPNDIAPTWKFATTEDSTPFLEKFLKEQMEDADVTLDTFADEKALQEAFKEGGNYFIGLVIDKNAKEILARGEKPKARVYVNETSTPESQETARAIGAMIASALFIPPNENKKEVEELGPVVEEANFHEQSRALMAIFILMMEMLALASLISREISSGVVHGVLTTVVSLPRYFIAKVLFGVLLAFIQAAFVAALTGGMNAAPLLIGLHLLLGAFIFTTGGIIAGTRGKHLMEVLMWGMLFIIPSMVPAIVAMLPGTAPLLVQLLPTYPLINGVLSAGQSTPLVAPWIYLLWSAGWAAVLGIISFITLRRRVK